MRFFISLSFILFFISLFLKRIDWLLILFSLEVILFFTTKNSPILFLKKVLFIIGPLLGIGVLNITLLPIIFLKSLIAFIFFSLLTKNFSAEKLVNLFQTLHLPSYMGEIFFLAFRYSHTFVTEINLIKKNLHLRGSFKKKYLFESSFLGPLIGNLFLRTFKKSERVHQAMKLRGY